MQDEVRNILDFDPAIVEGKGKEKVYGKGLNYYPEQKRFAIEVYDEAFTAEVFDVMKVVNVQTGQVCTFHLTRTFWLDEELHSWHYQAIDTKFPCKLVIINGKRPEIIV